MFTYWALSVNNTTFLSSTTALGHHVCPPLLQQLPVQGALHLTLPVLQAGQKVFNVNKI